VSFKGISQTDTIKKIVLDEKVAREVVKDLVKGDICKQLLSVKDERISNLKNQISELRSLISIKDSIIVNKDKIIKVQDKVIGWWKKPELHGYMGMQSIQFTTTNPIIYGKVLLELPKIKVGVQGFVQPNNPAGYSVIVEYKLF
jgi:hypothetical protein